MFSSNLSSIIHKRANNAEGTRPVHPAVSSNLLRIQVDVVMTALRDILEGEKIRARPCGEGRECLQRVALLTKLTETILKYHGKRSVERKTQMLLDAY